ncbi:hypothetical protein EB796_022724 [Bugula neritina]|uniref:Uncharacterized protein n=1 Tax=Bugula neritina TaxID=10212 RepID=A0A7J7IYG6_BUGNE|nr:hypothetical protein EB796_022724 [Bugula neritina]
MAADRPVAAKSRKLSIVSFDEHNSTRVDVQYGRRLGAAPAAANGRLVSAGSAVSTASTWSFVNKPAASIQALRNRILITLDKALSLIKEFEQRYLYSADDDFHGIYQEFVKQLLARIGYKNDLINCEHLETVIIRRFQPEQQIARRADFKSLAIVCARHRAFKDLRAQVQNRIDEVYTYADTFCVTFSNEAEGLSFESVENYENIKTDCLRELRVYLDAGQASCDELKDIQPVSVFLESYSRVLHHMENVTSCLHNATMQLKKWVIADEQYEKSLDKEIMFLKHRSGRVAADRITVSSLKFDVKTRIPNASGKLRKVEMTLEAMQAAIWEISAKVGSNWPGIYMKLPFMPLRTNEKKSEDIKGVMRAGAHMDKEPSEMAAMAFEKWAKRSTAANINELTFAAKPFLEESSKKELSKKVKYSVPRTKKRFQQLRAKPSVIYV